ncbi:hypothetical protein Sgleb_24430 [Streptomyces glebosus]|uniref:Uncharacterized protein n=1 Tax=Streptomyces glebosus TaxID=249580 RepID=A0A640SWD7_9ACTN|nr:hypothetical protein [Streptomyces glebosus]GFE14396.1 hypothetical protein Sgleb_24430 [Streptomyces glebosus]GHG55262.1 hypothetical protein GCM10010513_17260 [Streptomyces glebosus]
MRTSTGLISTLLLGAALSLPVTAAQAAPAAPAAASVSAAVASCHGLITKAYSLNSRAISASRAGSFKKAAKRNHATEGKIVNALAACRHARHRAEIRHTLDAARNDIQGAEDQNKRAYIEHDRRYGRAALNDEYDAQRRLRDAAHYS